MNKNILTFIGLLGLVFGVAWLAADLKSKETCGE